MFFGLMTIFSGLVTSFGAFLVLRSLVGIGEGTFYGASFGLSSQSIPNRYLTIGMAIINSGQAVGQIIGTVLSSLLVLQYHMHWSLPFIIVGVPTIFVGVMYILNVPRKQTIVRANKRHVGSHASNKIAIKSLLTRNLLCIYAMLFASIYGQITVLTWLPLFLTNYRHMSGQNVGLIASIVPFIAIPSALFFARLNDKKNQARSLIFILVPISALAIVAGITINNSADLIISLIVYGLTGKMAIDPILLYAVKKNAAAHQLATTFGVYNFFGMIASVLAPVITGFLIDMMNMAVAFYFAALLLLGGMLLFGLMIPEKRRVS